MVASAKFSGRTGRRTLGPLWTTLLFVLGASCGWTAEDIGGKGSVEYSIKAAYLYNFTRFIEWPPAALPVNGPFVVGVLTHDRVASEAIRDAFRDKRMASGRSIEVRILSGITDDLLACQLVFVARDASVGVEDVRRAVGTRPVLIVGDTAGSAQHGGEIDFVVSADVVRIEINLQRAELAGLKLSGRLANVARLVRDPEP